MATHIETELSPPGGSASEARRRVFGMRPMRCSNLEPALDVGTGSKVSSRSKRGLEGAIRA
jgi:hypothetical protein